MIRWITEFWRHKNCLAISNFDKAFLVETNNSTIGICAVLAQENKPIELFSEKLCHARQCWSGYEHELYTVVKVLNYQNTILLQQDFILFNNHKAIQYINTEKNINRCMLGGLCSFINLHLYSNIKVMHITGLNRSTTHRKMDKSKRSL